MQPLKPLKSLIRFHSDRGKTVKILAISSSGGHWIQLLRLRPAFVGCRVTYVTTFSGADSSLSGERSFKILDSSKSSKLKLLFSSIQIFFILLRVRPNVIVTTGAAPGVISLVIGRLFGARRLWIDSIANGEELSLAGKIATKHAHLCLTQWPHIAERSQYVEFRGSIL